MSVPNVLPSGTLVENILTELADNNAGAISAYDVRHNMADIVASINWIVASGNFNSSTPFYKNVRIKKTDGDNTTGSLIPESGVLFPYADGNGSQLQLIAYNGPTSIDHNELANLSDGDVHLQYMNLNGVRAATSNIGFDDNWINSSGSVTPGQGVTGGNNRGLSFEYTGNGTEVVHIGSGSYLGSGTYFNFDNDNSIMKSAKGVAKAWLNFDGEFNTPVINSYYNIHALRKLETGKYQIVFTSGTFADNNYIAIGSSNARSSADSREDFTVNTVGIVLRSGDDADTLRNLTFAVLDEGGQYVDAKINELVVYGMSPGEISGVHPQVIVDTTTTTTSAP